MTATEPEAATKATLQAAYGRLPLHFEANQGQSAAQVQFLARGYGYSLFLTSSEAVLVLGSAEWGMRNAEFKSLPSSFSAQPSASKLHPPSLQPSDARLQTLDSRLVLRLQLVGANPTPQVAGLEELPGKVNYFLGNDPTQWRTNLPTYTKVKYQNVYPGVDLVYYGNQRQLEYDFVVAPGVDPQAIQLTFEGADKLAVDAGGDLILQTAGGELRLHKPRVYQELNGVQHEIWGSYVLLGAPAPNPQPPAPAVGFAVAAYDSSRPLVIDPVLAYSTYLGGNDDDWGRGIAVDAAGNVYVTGQTYSTDFPILSPFQPTAGGSYDTFVTKLDATGSTLLYSTYLGGSGGDRSQGITVDAAGNVYVTGQTYSTDFPTRNPFQAAFGGGSDAFVTKLDAAGSRLLYSTYLGGSDDERGRSIAVDAAGNVYVTGQTYSTDFPILNPFQPAFAGGSDAFVTKLDAAGSMLRYSTYLGGSGGESGYGIAVDAAGNAYVTGQTYSTDFPILNPFQPAFGGGFFDAFVTKLDAAGSTLLYSTYLGGSNTDWGRGIAVDAAGNAAVTGLTKSLNFPTAQPVQPAFGGFSDAFVTKLDAAGSTLLYSTYLGGSDSEESFSIAVDTAGNAYVAGLTKSTDFPMVRPVQPAPGGDLDVHSDAFVTVLDAAGSAIVYSTYLGGSGGDLGQGIAVDIAGNAYVTGGTMDGFPTVNPVQPAFGGGDTDAFVAKIADPSICGDGVEQSTEQCDDGNTTDRDGCSSICTVETGYSCRGNPSVCTPICGDGLVKGTEQCDLGANNGQPGFCCSATCQLKPADTVCRAAAGACDVAETCDGVNPTCPANGFKTAGTVCRPVYAACDVAEMCTGTSAFCPANGFKAAGVVCRPAAGVCDVAEMCTGTSAFCPANGLKAAGTACPDDGNACTLDQCDGTSPACRHPVSNAGSICRAAAGACDVAETCDGVTPTCPANGFKTAGTVCRPAAGVCDVAEMCTGTSAFCPANGLKAAGVVCRPAVGVCDVTEACTGTNPKCPADGFQPNGTTCDDGDATTCGDQCTVGSCAGTPC